VLDDAELSTYGGVRIYLSTLAVTLSVRAEADCLMHTELAHDA